MHNIRIHKAIERRRDCLERRSPMHFESRGESTSPRFQTTPTLKAKFGPCVVSAVKWYGEEIAPLNVHRVCQSKPETEASAVHMLTCAMEIPLLQQRKNRCSLSWMDPTRMHSTDPLLVVVSLEFPYFRGFHSTCVLSFLAYLLLCNPGLAWWQLGLLCFRIYPLFDSFFWIYWSRGSLLFLVAQCVAGTYYRPPNYMLLCSTRNLRFLFWLYSIQFQFYISIQKDFLQRYDYYYAVSGFEPVICILSNLTMNLSPPAIPFWFTSKYIPSFNEYVGFVTPSNVPR